MFTSKSLLYQKLREAVRSVVPITAIVLILSFTIAPLPVSEMMAFTIGAILLIFGMALFTLGADLAMTPIGERVGVAMTRSRKLWIMVSLALVLGIVITMSEPDLTVLATQVPSISNGTIILCVSVGVGVFLVLALLRILFRWKLRLLFVGFYVLVFLLALFAPKDFLAVAFDSGGVTTGPMTVPFIMSLGVGLCSIRSDANAETDSFGLVALCSIGPILAMLLLSLFSGTHDSTYTMASVPEIADTQALARLFLEGFPKYLKEVALSLAPIFGFFLLFQIFSLKVPRKKFLHYIAGLVYTYVGLVLFLTGVNVGFMPLGIDLGRTIAVLDLRWIIIPISMLIGYFIVAAEPAVHVLNKQVETITAGAISGRAMSLSLSIGVSVSLALAMIRVLTGISILWFVVPGYILAIGMTFIVPEMFSAIAFDSGGVASGPMTATFLLPFAVGACAAVGGDIVRDAFGVVAMVAMTPLITIQMLGVVYKLKLRFNPPAAEEPAAAEEEEIIEL